MWLIFLFILSTFANNMDSTSVMFCVPHTLKSMTRETLFEKIDTCLRENYIRFKQNTTETLFNDYIGSYMDALTAKQASELADNELFLSRHEFTMTLNNYKIEASRHVHAVEQCSRISHRMPSVIVDAYGNEAEMMFYVSDLWMHHIVVDLARCYKILKDIVVVSHGHGGHHIQTLYSRHKNLLLASQKAHAMEITSHASMLSKRDEIIKIL
tara:strand:- start:6679 stop:7314 length:636 start_codon:yes stop_codon:yes gene_type:complete